MTTRHRVAINGWAAVAAGPALAATMIVACTSASSVDTDEQGSGRSEAIATSTATDDEPSTTTSVPAIEPTSTTATDSTTEAIDDEAAGGCDLGPVPSSAGHDPFYTQGCRIDGFWVVANEVVDPEAIARAAETVERIFATDQRLAPTLAASGIRLGLIGRNQRTTEMPEYRDLNEVFPETDWDTRARGLGATFERPLVSAGEENVLCLPDDRYLGEDILLHEFSHVLHQFGFSTIDPDFDGELFAAYQQAITDGTWDDTYAATDAAEYWAEGVQSYLGRNLTSEPADGIHGPIDTKAELEAADPALFDLIDRWLGTVELPPQCG